MLARLIRDGWSVAKLEFWREEVVVAKKEGYKWLEAKDESKDDDRVNENEGCESLLLSREDSKSVTATWADWSLRAVIVKTLILRLVGDTGRVGHELP